MIRGYTRRFIAAAIFCGLAACGGGSSNNGTPTTPTPTATRIIEITGDLSFGDLLIGTSADRQIAIRNKGTAMMTVSSMNAPCTSFFAASWTNGQISAGGSQNVNIRFAPTAAQSCVGELTVNADHTSGQNTIPINARGVMPSTPTPAPSTCGPRTASCGQATAVCNDGTLSCSQNRQGTCSSHDGVSCWICPGVLCSGLTAPAEGQALNYTPVPFMSGVPQRR
jgi:hypothetical protein